MPTHFDLFSGIGGFALAAQWTGFRTVGLCEIDPWCRGLLAERFPGVPVHADVRGLRGEAMGHMDLLTGGFPCQPWSAAGKQLGARDDRHLWPEMLRLVRECRPAWVIGENVAGIIPLALDACLADLEAAGYAARAFVVPAVAVDAPHRRDRVWIVAHASTDRCGLPPQHPGDDRAQAEEQAAGSHVGLGPVVSHADGLRCGPESERFATPRLAWGEGGCRWHPEPGLGRVADGLPDDVESQIAGFGNAIVPQVAAEFMHAIRQLIA